MSLWAEAGFGWENSAAPAVAAAHRVVDTRLRAPVALISHGGPNLGYAGPAHGVVKIAQLLDDLRATPSTGTRRWTMRRADLERGRHLPDADLLAVGCTPAVARGLPRRAALVLPYRLHLVVDLVERWPDAVTKGERQWVRTRRRERDWRLEVAADEPSFDHFYDDMHVPTMLARHGDHARGEPRDRARECLFRTGVLVFARLDGRRVAGGLCHRSADGATLTLRLVGVLDGAPEHYADGALKVMYHLLLEWAHRTGFRHVDFGGTEAWLSKGIFRWKRRFGPRVVPAPNHLGGLRVWWHVRRDTPDVRDFLVANPVFEVVDRGLRAVYFHDDDRPPRRDIGFSCANVHESRAVHLDAFLEKGESADVDAIVVR